MTGKIKDTAITSEPKAKNEFDILNQTIDSGNCFLIEASAGTGKTYNILHLYLRLILERGLEVGEILAVTFTEAATAELRTKIRNNLQAASDVLERIDIGDEKLQELLERILEQAKLKGDGDDELRRRLRLALISFDEAAIFTIHGFCSRMLNENAFESRISFDLELIEDQQEILSEIMSDFWRRNFYGVNEIFATALEFCRCSPDKLLTFAKLIVSKPELVLEESEAFEVSDAELKRRLLELAQKVKTVPTAGNTNKANVRLMRQLETIDLTAINDTETAIRVLSLIEKNTIAGVDREKVPFNAAVVISIKKALYAHLRNDKPMENRKRALRLQSYDDMLIDLRTALRDKTGNQAPECDLAMRLRSRYKAAMIDEFQDTDPVQCEIFNTLFRHKDSFFVMIGDPKQSIYRFRSADVYSYLETKGNKSTESRTLTKSFRSAQTLLDGVNELFDGDAPFLETRIPYVGVVAGKKLKRKLILPPEYEKKTFQFDWVQTTEDKGIAKSNVSVIEHTADRIVKALCDYKWETEAQGVGKTESLRPRDIAILVPENKHATQIQTALKRRGVTAVISNSGNVFNSAMAKEVYFLLRAIQNPENGKYLKTALGGKLFRFPEKLLADIAGNEESGSGNDTDRLAFWADRFKEYRADWEKKGVMPMLSSLVMMENLHPDRIEEKGTAWTSGNPIKRGIENLAEPRPAVDGLDDRERNIVDMRHLMELLHKTESEQSLSSELLLAWLQRMLKNSFPKETDPEALQTRLETDQEAVTIMTIHKSKGLQFPIVFSPLLWNRNYELEPQKKDTDWFCHSFQEKSPMGLVMPLGEKAKEAHRHQGEIEALGELLRVAYVAATRAEHFCCLLYGNFSGDCTRTSLNYLLKKDLRGEGFFENNVMPVGNAPPQFNNIRVFPVEVEKLTYPENPEKYEQQETCTKKLKTCDLRNNFVVPKNWGIMSYSSLGKHKVSHAPLINVSGGTDEAKQTPEAVKTPEEESEKELSLPSNEKTGLCFHEIMEHLNFTLVNGDSHGKWSETPSIRELIENKMRKYGLIRGKRSTAGTEDPLLAERYPLICKTIHQTLITRIPGTCAGNAFSFNEIGKKDRISEMEFFYEIKGAINRDKLKEIARELLQNTVMEEDNESEADADNVVKDRGINTGFMTGSIDIIFRTGSRYCFADWKTNTLDNYDTKGMWNKMFNASYILQHLIYSLTLHLYLENRLGENYDFEKYFGGGYYIFVRGLELNGEKGILANRIGKNVLNQLKGCIYNITEKIDGVAQ